jgi:hypothetical protein
MPTRRKSYRRSKKRTYKKKYRRSHKKRSTHVRLIKKVLHNSLEVKRFETAATISVVIGNTTFRWISGTDFRPV